MSNVALTSFRYEDKNVEDIKTMNARVLCKTNSMGSNPSFSKSNIAIEFLTGNRNVQHTSHDFNGIIHFTTDVYPLDNVVIQFIGELVYTTYQRKGKSTITTERQVSFVHQTIQYKENERQEKKLAKNEYQFSFALDCTLPPSLEQLHPQGPFIHYFLRVRSLNDQFQEDFPIIIQRPADLLDGHLEEVQNKPSEEVQLAVNLKNNLACIGQHLSGEIRLYNPHSRTIERISWKLIQIRKIGPAKEERTVLRKENLVLFDKFKGESYNNQFQIEIPYGIHPTCSYRLPNRWFIFVHYEIQIKVHRRGISKNPSLTVPILINTKTDVGSA